MIFLRMMQLRNLVGTRSIILCNFVFSICMSASVVVFIVHSWLHRHALTSAENFYVAYEIFLRVSCVVFFLVATYVYFRLWSLYRFSNANMKRRLLETAPSICASLAVLILLYLGLLYNGKMFRPYVWGTFA